MFTKNKINEFANRIADLPDRPQMSAQALKAYFDGSSEELRVAHNALVDALNGFEAGSIANVAYSAADGKLTFTLGDGSSKVIDLPLELLIQSGAYDSETQSIVLTLANGDALNIYVGDLIDTYSADGATLVLNGSTFSVKDGVFTKEAPTDGKAYARKDASWAEVLDSLPEITIEQADDAIEGVYKVVKVEHAHRYYGVLCAYADCYLYEYADVVLRQTILWSDGKIENRRREEYVMDADNVVQREDGTCIPKDGYTWYNAWSAWKSVIPSLSGYATDAYVDAEIAAAKPNDFELIASGTTTEEVNSILITTDNDGNPFELCDRVFVYTYSPEAAVTSAITLNFDGRLVTQTTANGIDTANERYVLIDANYMGRQWKCYVANNYSTSSIEAVRMVSALSANHTPTVSNINIYIYNSALVLPVGFTYEIYGRRVKK